jgi:large subunit ribosomal protein L22
MAEDKKQLHTGKLVVAHAKSLRIAPRKMRLVTNVVKNMQVQDAITQLQFMNKKGAPMLIKLIKSAVANGEHNFQIKPEDLFIKSLTCDMGQTMGRYFPRARGSAFVIRRKMSHVHLTLEERKGKKKSRKASLLTNKEDKPKETGVGTPDQATENSVEQRKAVMPKAVKTSEQVKMNTVAQKRRPRQTQNKG